MSLKHEKNSQIFSLSNDFKKISHDLLTGKNDDIVTFKSYHLTYHVQVYQGKHSTPAPNPAISLVQQKLLFIS